MSIESLYTSGMDFETFISTDDESYKEKALEIYNSIEVDDDLLKRIKEINRKINILVFAEIWCPDCIINVPALKKLCDINSNIEVKIVPRKGNEKYLEDYKVNGKVKIPTFLFMDDNFNILGKFIEIPQAIRKIVSKGNQVDIIVAKRKYRKGEYINETIEDILNIIV
ncbi:Thioredoxin [Caminicella sporogenes DSM 14501]|uniref:Thioredoxin n=1 Tax=Caminicella sporogenes DSM 14501 TaxID=1121266 RepID=A0A1M6STJ2_9FIRM|nr:thioredoxin family protein [Caminicella sporogenes]RKD26395.1 hypothetical protein BET04_10555 [Caminicella sporogenes]SHK47950.1 Thioredoxin [Caminicella sporogenes DSM 14501]